MTVKQDEAKRLAREVGIAARSGGDVRALKEQARQLKAEPEVEIVVLPDERMRLTDAVESLTGFERIAIEDYFLKDLSELTGTRLVIGVIAMLSVRDGMKARDAWVNAKALNMKATNDYFAPDEAEEATVVIEDEDEDPAGKDDAGNEIETGPTPGSPSLPESPSLPTTTSDSPKVS